MGKKEKPDFTEFVDAILCLQSRKECDMFFRDILSTHELAQIAQRFEIAKLLYDGATYREIIALTNSANVTISRVKTALERDESVLMKLLDRMNDNIRG